MEGEAGEAAGDSCLGAAAENTLQPFPTSLGMGTQERGPTGPASVTSPALARRHGRCCSLQNTRGRGWQVAECHVDTCLLKQGWGE